MTKKQKEEILQTQTIEQFNELLFKYAPEYGNLKMDDWDKDIEKHLIDDILETTKETLEEMDGLIVEYKD